MSLIDERGRLFGRVNLIDAIVAVLVLGLIPLAYGAFLMFRVPVPKITGVTPDRVIAHQPSVVQITGEDLRQFLEVYFGKVASNGVFVKASTRADVLVPELPEGTYDLTLVSEGKVLLVKPAALTVVAPPPIDVTHELQGVGSFNALTEAEARSIVQGAKFGSDPAVVAEVLTARVPEPATVRLRVGDNAFITVPLPGRFRVAALLRLRCAFVDGACKLGEVFVTPAAAIALPSPPGSRPLTFVVDEVRPSDAPPAIPPARAAVATMRVRFAADPGVVDLMTAGDIDIAGYGVVAESDRAVLTQFGSDRQVTSGLVGTESVLRRSVQLQRPLIAVTGTVRAPVLRGPTGWTYKYHVVKAGAGFTFETVAGGMTGWILDVKIDSER